MTGLGTSRYGLENYGGLIVGEIINITGAVAYSTHEVRITLNNSARHVSSFGIGDALNPATWSVQRLNTLEYLDIIAVNIYTAQSYGIVTMQAFGGADVSHEVSSNTLLSANGVLITPPNTARFLGVVDQASHDPLQAIVNIGASIQDIHNPPVPKSAGGTLKIGTSGDYEAVSGSELVRKLIIRRLTTNTGEFFHLPDYGIGLPEKLPMPTAELVKLKSTIEKQIIRENEVESVVANLSMDSTGILNIKVRAKLRPTGESIDIGLKATPSSVVL